VTDERTQELASNLASVRQRLAAACRAAGRAPDEVCLIVVTKTFPAADVLRLASLGVTDVGENRDQEAAGKAAEVAAAGGQVRWHFVGHLQRNKCRSVVGYADMVHSVDSVRLAVALAQAARHRRDHKIDALVQVSLDGDASRGGAVHSGAEPDVHLDRVLASVAGADELNLRGLMAVAPLDWDPDRAFAELAATAAKVRQHYPDAVLLSAGMSGDVEQAIEHGATHVRLGSAVLGNRINLM
jgi:pyridoxal phosphate enzyme (YggS family)